MNRKIIKIGLITVLLLLIPLVAMQFTDEVNWNLGDFVFAGILIFGTRLAYELAVRRSRVGTYRTAIGLALAATLLLMWVNGAVGIIGNEGNSANLMYGGVVAIGIVGTIIAKLKPQKMMGVLIYMAIAQVSVPIIALVVWNGQDIWGAASILGVFALNTFFVLLFTVSALLFRHSNPTNGFGE